MTKEQIVQKIESFIDKNGIYAKDRVDDALEAVKKYVNDQSGFDYDQIMAFIEEQKSGKLAGIPVQINKAMDRLKDEFRKIRREEKIKNPLDTEKLYSYVFWYNFHQNLWYGIDSTTLNDFFSGNREKSIYFVDSSEDLVKKRIANSQPEHYTILIDGKVVSSIIVTYETQSQITARALSDLRVEEIISRHNRSIIKKVFVENKLINIVTKLNENASTN